MSHIRNGFISGAAWLGALTSLSSSLVVQLPRSPRAKEVSLGVQNITTPSLFTLDAVARLIGIASLLGTLTVLIYRLGVWRQEMEQTKHDVANEVKAHREESADNFDRVERRLEAIDHLLGAMPDRLARARRWQSRAERRLERLELAERAKTD